MRWMSIVLGTAAMLLVTGCLMTETVETRIEIRGDNEPALVAIVYGNISSGESDEEDVRKDFQALLKDWKGDQYLLDRAEEGLYLKTRDVFIKDDTIYGRITGIVKNVEKWHYSFWVSHDERIMIFDPDEDFELVDTNGQILKTKQNTLIVWPDDAKELWWKQRLTERHDEFDINQKLLLKMLGEYLEQEGQVN